MELHWRPLVAVPAGRKNIVYFMTQDLHFANAMTF